MSLTPELKYAPRIIALISLAVLTWYWVSDGGQIEEQASLGGRAFHGGEILGHAPVGNRTWGAVQPQGHNEKPQGFSINTISPFEALDCKTAEGLQKNKELCFPDANVPPEEEGLPMGVALGYTVETLSEANVGEAMSRINSNLLGCAIANTGILQERGFIVDADSVIGCEPEKLAGLAQKVESKLSTMTNSKETEAATLSWRTTQLHQIRAMLEASQAKTIPLSQDAANSLHSEYKAAKIRLRTFLENMAELDDSEQVTLYMLKYEDEISDSVKQ